MPATAEHEYRSLFAFTDQLLLWLADHHPDAYQVWARQFVDMNLADCGPSDGSLLAQVEQELDDRPSAPPDTQA